MLPELRVAAHSLMSKRLEDQALAACGGSFFQLSAKWQAAECPGRR